jgi:uroporphyrinogen-III synthase
VIVRVLVTRPLPDGERTAMALRARGHDVLVAPLLAVETLNADLTGDWPALIVTSTNALRAIESNPDVARLHDKPLFAVGTRTASAARDAGFRDVTSADGDARDLVRVLTAYAGEPSAPLLYLAGRDRAFDIAGAVAGQGLAVKTVEVYRAVTLPFPAPLVDALRANTLDAVLHYSRRSAEAFVAGARAAGVAAVALALRQLRLSDQVAVPVRDAGASTIAVAAHPDEASLFGLLDSRGN